MMSFPYWTIFLWLAAAPAAHAYIGPGPGLSMLGSLFALVGGVLLALAMVLFYPIRLWLKHRRSRKGNDSTHG